MTVRTVCVTVGAEVTVSGLSPEAEAEIVRACTMTNPAFARKERLGLWTGGTDRTLATWRRTPSGLQVPPGCFSLVIGVCREHRLAHTVEDRTVRPPLGLALAPHGTLYGFQARALDDLLRHRTGFLVAPTGSGKTNVLLSAIPRLGTTTLILTHTAGLQAQTIQRCRDWLGVDPGRIGGGQWYVRPITVATIQTLARRGCETIADYFGAVLIDEAHHAPALTWAAVANGLTARYKYGFTATAWRKDGLDSLMWQTIGPVVARVQQADVVAAGTILEPDIEVVKTAFAFDLLDSTEWGQMITALVTDGDRNALIAHEARARLTPDSKALILVDRIDHACRLGALLHDLDPIVLTGNLAKAARETAMATIRDGATLTIATAAMLGEGIDVPAWDVLFLASPFAGGPRTVQAVGRVCRAAPGKSSALVIDFLDVRVPALVAAHQQRERVLGAAA